MDSLYRTMLFVPGNEPSKISQAEIYRADSIVYDLEDAVAVSEKDAARILIANALREIRPDCPVGVRINPLDTEFGLEDLRAVTPCRPDFIRLPKAENKAQLDALAAILSELERECGLPDGGVKIVATIESAKGVLQAAEIAAANARMLAVGLGAEDFCTDMGVSRSDGGAEIALARAMVVMAARAAGILALDIVYSDVKNEKGFIDDVTFGRRLGYSGKSVVHPSQVRLVHDLYAPAAAEIARARDVLAAYREALARGSGVIALDGKMIDMPMVRRARSILSFARAAGMEVDEDAK